MKKVYFDDIDNIEKVSPKHLKKIVNHKNFLYSKIVYDVYKLYYDLFIDFDEMVLRDFIKQTIIKSRESNKLVINCNSIIVSVFGILNSLKFLYLLFNILCNSLIISSSVLFL